MDVPEVEKSWYEKTREDGLGEKCITVPVSPITARSSIKNILCEERWSCGRAPDCQSRGRWFNLTFRRFETYRAVRTAQSTLHFTSLTDLFNQIPSQLLWEASSHMVQLMHEGCSYTYPPLSIARYSFIQLSELEQCRVKKLAQGFNTAAEDSNPGPLSQESEALPLSHSALCSL